MNIDVAIRIVDAVTKLLGVLLWPAVVLFVLIRFGSVIQNFIGNVAEFSIKAPGVDVSATRKQAEAADLLSAAIQEKHLSDVPTPDARDVVKVATPEMIRRAEHATILWVDDRPLNNALERQALEVLGFKFVTATSTEKALQELRRRSFDIIISDMGRPQDSAAGFTLLDAIRAGGNHSPFIIYTSASTAEKVAEAHRRGAEGYASRPDELFRMVMSVLG